MKRELNKERLEKEKIMSKKVYIVAAKRTAMGSFRSSLASVSSTELGATVIKAVMDDIKLEKHYVDEVYMYSLVCANCGKVFSSGSSKLYGLSYYVSSSTYDKC